MTVADVDALLYLPGHTRQGLLRGLRVPALSPGWQGSFRALLMRQPGRGNAGLTVTSPPPAWPGFRQLSVTAITRESDSAISLRFEYPDGAPLPAGRAGQYLTLRIQHHGRERRCCATIRSPDDRGRLLPDHRQARTRGVASGYLHTRLAVGDHLDIAAPRGTFIFDQTPAPVLLISAGIGAAPVLAMLQALAQERSDREIWCLYGARDGREHPFAAESRALSPRCRTHGPTSTTAALAHRHRRPRLRPCGSSHRLCAREDEPTLRRRGIPVRTCRLHGRDQRGLGRLGVRWLPDPHRTVRAGPARRLGSNRLRHGRPTHPPAGPEPARRSRSPAATSRSHGAATTELCSNSPSPATCLSAGHVAPASAKPARQRSSPGVSTTNPTRSNLPPKEACSSAVHSPATT